MTPPGLEFVLKDLVEIEGVLATAVLTMDGIEVESVGLEGCDLSASSALFPVIAMMTRTAEKCSRLLKKGDVKEIIINADSGVLIMEICGKFVFHVLVDKDTDLYPIKPKIEEARAVIKGVI